MFAQAVEFVLITVIGIFFYCAMEKERVKIIAIRFIRQDTVWWKWILCFIWVFHIFLFAKIAAEESWGRESGEM